MGDADHVCKVQGESGRVVRSGGADVPGSNSYSARVTRL